jgi:hypothetical protein
MNKRDAANILAALAARVSEGGYGEHELDAESLLNDIQDQLLDKLEEEASGDADSGVHY